MAAHNYAFALLWRVASENKRADYAAERVSATRHDRDAFAWNIICVCLDGRSSARFMSLQENIMLRPRPGQPLME
jgi:hypothetical protein